MTSRREDGDTKRGQWHTSCISFSFMFLVSNSNSGSSRRSLFFVFFGFFGLANRSMSSGYLLETRRGKRRGTRFLFFSWSEDWKTTLFYFILSQLCIVLYTCSRLHATRPN
ncbi:MAG: hypothetical protein J3R72DRAFT_432643 [Linnemannia gamsii]|nr:MAG: hypothetical protein J3R72DRAFT_432643 [Linnemannia gamsii]